MKITPQLLNSTKIKTLEEPNQELNAEKNRGKGNRVKMKRKVARRWKGSERIWVSIQHENDGKLYGRKVKTIHNQNLNWYPPKKESELMHVQYHAVQNTSFCNLRRKIKIKSRSNKDLQYNNWWWLFVFLGERHPSLIDACLSCQFEGKKKRHFLNYKSQHPYNIKD